MAKNLEKSIKEKILILVMYEVPDGDNEVMNRFRSLENLRIDINWDQNTLRLHLQMFELSVVGCVLIQWGSSDLALIDDVTTSYWTENADMALFDDVTLINDVKLIEYVAISYQTKITDVTLIDDVALIDDMRLTVDVVLSHWIEISNVA